MLRPAFTLLEILIIIAILAILGGISVPVYTQYLVRSDLTTGVQLVSQGLSRAKLLAQSGQGGDSWSFTASGVLFEGSSYTTRDTSHDEYYTLPSSISVSGIQQVTFQQLTGKPDQIGSMVLNSYGLSRTVPIVDSY